MWPGPYGEWGSRKYLLASLDQSLRRMGLDYVDIFYSHRPDPDTPLEETMGALDHAVRQGKALYAGISNYPADRTAEAASILRDSARRASSTSPATPCSTAGSRAACSTSLEREGIGCIAFSPLAQGLLTDKYLAGIPTDSRAVEPHGFLRPEHVTPDKVERARKLNEIAQARGQTLAQMALPGCCASPASPRPSSARAASRQIDENLDALVSAPLSAEELRRIEAVLK